MCRMQQISPEILWKICMKWIWILNLLYCAIVLQGSECGSRQTLIGTILHEIFQQSVTNNLSPEKVEELANKIVFGQKYLREM